MRCSEALQHMVGIEVEVHFNEHDKGVLVSA